MVLTTNDEIAMINRDYRDLFKPTDVLSFPMIDYVRPGDFSVLEEGLTEDFFNPESGELIQFLSVCDVPHIILMEATGRRIFEEIGKYYPAFNGTERIKLVYHLDGAVALAKKICRQGHCCVMSPAAASYGIFKNFEARGEAFAELVREGV